MAVDERFDRNFRSAYYEKVGFKGVEEKKSLEILLKDKPLDRQRLKQFCLRFHVPKTHRISLWKLVLGITPKYTDNCDFIWKQRTETYEELLRALQVMQIVKPDTPKPLVLLFLWLLETGEIKCDIQAQLDDPVFKGLIAVSNSVLEIVPDEVDAYWIARAFYNLVYNFKDTIPRISDATRIIIEKEDPELYTHLIKLAAFDVIWIDRWFLCLFAGVLCKSALFKIWDKLVGGSLKILTFVAVVLLTTLRRHLLAATTGEAILDELNGISDETSEVIGNKAVDLWQKYGSPLQAGDMRKEDSR